MSFETPGGPVPTDNRCQYGTSRLNFRGPRRDLNGSYVAVLGGTETYGQRIEAPYPSVAEDILGIPFVNFGCVNAGVDAFLNDPHILAAAGNARATVLQVLGALNMSNRFYSVHPRRNDRFVNASAALKKLYPEMDFTEFHFTRHLIGALEQLGAERFQIVREELQAAWSARMVTLVARIESPVFLLWMGCHPPAIAANGVSEPMFITRDMLEGLSQKVAGKVVVSGGGQQKNSAVNGPLDETMAQTFAGPSTHGKAGQEMASVLAQFFPVNAPKRSAS